MDTQIVLAAVLAGLAAWWWGSNPAAALRAVPGGRRRPLPSWARARPDAASPGLRRSVSVVVGTAVLVMLPGWGGLLLGALAVPVTTVLLGQLSTGRGRRERARVVLELPETLDLLAAALESGAPMRLAVAEVAQAGPPSTGRVLEGVRARVGIGISDADAWRSLEDDPDWSVVARDLARSAETGTAAAQILRRHAEDARGRRRDEMLKRARRVGVRSVLPLMCCFLPAFLLTGVVPIVAGLIGPLLHR